MSIFLFTKYIPVCFRSISWFRLFLSPDDWPKVASKLVCSWFFTVDWSGRFFPCRWSWFSKNFKYTVIHWSKLFSFYVPFSIEVHTHCQIDDVYLDHFIHHFFSLSHLVGAFAALVLDNLIPGQHSLFLHNPKNYKSKIIVFQLLLFWFQVLRVSVAFISTERKEAAIPTPSHQTCTIWIFWFANLHQNRSHAFHSLARSTKTCSTSRTF